ncbi:MAG: methionine--tRNA ligase [Saprospiraceae bacterium]|nr:methionine--tRNA ligase [Saprospiraceae bacterium]
MFNASRYLVTAALPYANGPLHIGHLAGCYLPSDIYCRFLRLTGKDVLLICGSDEHGAAITTRAKKEGVTPKEIVDKYHEMFLSTFDKFGISFDFYHRTSDKLHHETSQAFFLDLYKKGEFTETESEQYYDEESQQFLADRYITGTCPKCGYEEAFGDQCENCGSTLSPLELENPRSTLSGQPPVLRKTTHWYLPLDKYESWLREWIEEGTVDGKQQHEPDEWKNHVLGQCKSWIDSGLQPRAMTRDLEWGVDVPSEIEGHEGKKLYVWMDAPIGYISSTKQWAIDNGRDWKPYWMAEDTALIHFIGKDNIVFHCLIFPSILKAKGNFILPYNVPANQFLNLEGQKISTSRDWAVWVNEYIDDLPERIDELRFYLTRIMPEQRDSEFTWKGFQDAANNELVNNLANFVNRVIVLTNKYYEGEVPEFDENQDMISPTDADLPSFHDSELLDLFDQLHSVCDNLRKFEFRQALSEVMEISARGNQLLQYNEPWKNHESDPELVKAVMNVAIQYVAALSIVVRPFMPETSEKIRKLLQLPALEEKGELDDFLITLAEGESPVQPGHVVGSAKHLFTRVEDDLIEDQINKLKGDTSKEEIEREPVKPEINFKDFTKLDLRTATILEADKVEKADKLLKLLVDLGFETRTVVSGIAEYYKPEEVVGQQVVVVTNLAPRKIMGVESQGMILMVENGNGELGFVSPQEGWANGLTIR